MRVRSSLWILLLITAVGLRAHPLGDLSQTLTKRVQIQFVWGDSDSSWDLPSPLDWARKVDWAMIGNTSISIILDGVIGVFAGGVLFPLALILTLCSIGFTADGIIMGSMAAAWMASFGGFVPRGGCFACLQSIGAIGCRVGANPVAVCLGCIIGGCLGVYIGYSYPFHFID
jgi:hypothetical protein